LSGALVAVSIRACSGRRRGPARREGVAQTGREQLEPRVWLARRQKEIVGIGMQYAKLTESDVEEDPRLRAKWNRGTARKYELFDIGASRIVSFVFNRPERPACVSVRGAASEYDIVFSQEGSVRDLHEYPEGRHVARVLCCRFDKAGRPEHVMECTKEGMWFLAQREDASGRLIWLTEPKEVASFVRPPTDEERNSEQAN